MTTPVSSAPADAVTAAPAEWGDYLALMKPRVMTLVVFTAFAGYVAAPGSIHPVMAAIAIFALALGAGAAGALNMAYDADIDARMRRTRKRPVPQGKVSVSDAYGFGIVGAALSVILMALSANYVAAGLLAFSIFFYAVIYTMGLKRRTPQNIVIGGAAGAFPPMIGWAAATGSVSLDAVILFAIIFLWTPPHSWALALYKSGDYADAGVPMMPVAKGAARTRLEILIYSLILVPFAVAPVFTGLGGALYAVASVGGGALFLIMAVRVWQSKAGEAGSAEEGALYAVRKGDRHARDLFAYSIGYLALLFAALIAEHGLGAHVALGFGGAS
ncbi:heme o synthase [Hyphobacterium marinum]|uniref:Protoheme IX farnesyltransferase n=1 Tax=Hyphobacterium marinum TaxID=3116574 RepID=A0ABU7LWS6_9PROT|nr:heme o synthase [Hyphobacterium sp. Y6023]MEE2566008.1 heme o synthase [Hyphobacterium sp. Y6023]